MNDNVIEGKFGRDDKPWPADSWPTAEQFVDWFVKQPREEQIRQAGWITYEGQAAARCVLHNHDERIKQAEAVLRRHLYPQAPDHDGSDR